MSMNGAETAETAAAPTWAAGEVIWKEGEKATPLRVKKGIVAYRRGNIAIGLLGPGQVILPVPGVAGGSVAATDLVAVTETSAGEVSPADIQGSDLEGSVKALITGADRLGNMPLAQRLAAILLEMTALTSHPVVHCRQDVLAMVAAARRETVSTILSVWRDEDWIDTRYRRVIIRDRDALSRVLDEVRGAVSA